MTELKTVVVFGANGGSGRAVVSQALNGGHHVRAVTRHPEQLSVGHPRLAIVKADVTDAGSLDSAVAGADAVVSTLGTPYTRRTVSLYSTSARHLVAAMLAHKVTRLVAMTSSAVEAGAGRQGTFVDDRLVAPLIHRLGRSLYADMRRMEQIVRDSGLDWTLVRPPALADANEVGEYVTSGSYLRGRFATRPDVAAFMLREIDQASYSRQVAYVSSPYAHPSLLRTIWRDGLGR